MNELVVPALRGLSENQDTASLLCSQEPRLELVQGHRLRTKAHITRLGPTLIYGILEAATWYL